MHIHKDIKKLSISNMKKINPFPLESNQNAKELKESINNIVNNKTLDSQVVSKEIW